MGLDMTLSARKWFGSNEPLQTELSALCKSPTTVNEVICDAMYWRKANAIHQWFVTNVQGGSDDCGTYFVPLEELNNLIGLCSEALLSPEFAESILPTESGFFFGGTEYDEYYFDQLRETVEQLKELTTNPLWKGWDFHYQSSW